MDSTTSTVRSLAINILLLVTFASGAAYANPVAGKGAGAQSAQNPRGAKLPEAYGVVEDIDVAANYVILKHGPIANLHMDPMTMAFVVDDSRILKKLKVGDKVVFTAVENGEAPKIMSLKVKNTSSKP